MRPTAQQMADAQLLELARLNIQVRELKDSLLEYLRLEVKHRSAGPGVTVEACVLLLIQVTDELAIAPDLRRAIANYLTHQIVGGPN